MNFITKLLLKLRTRGPRREDEDHEGIYDLDYLRKEFVKRFQKPNGEELVDLQKKYKDLSKELFLDVVPGKPRKYWFKILRGIHEYEVARDGYGELWFNDYACWRRLHDNVILQCEGPSTRQEK